MQPNPKVSVYQNANPYSFAGNKAVSSIIATIRTEKFKPQTDYLRTLTDPEKAREYKAGTKNGDQYIPGYFWAVLWTGELGKEVANNKGLHIHSGLICIDKDNLPTDRIAILIQQLQEDEYTHAAFISPSGNGIKTIVRTECNTIEEHKAYFAQLTAYYASAYNLTTKDTVSKGSKPNLDPHCKNPNRLCFLPYDPNAYYNPDSAVMPLLEEYKTITQALVPIIPVQQEELTPIEDDTDQRIRSYLHQLQNNRIDLTSNYEDWLSIGLAFASLGEVGRNYFHEVSRHYSKYNIQETDAKFSELLRNRNGQVNIGTFFHLCQQVLYSIQTGHTSTPIQDWEEPIPLHTTLLSVLSVSDAMLPEPLRPWLLDISNRMKCPLDFVASATIVMLSSLIGTRLSIKPKFYDEWTITPNLWGAVIGDPSTMKTPSVAEVFKPLNRLITASRSKFEEDLQHHEAEQITYEAQKKVYSAQELDRLKGKNVANPVSFPESAKKPTERRYMTNDATVEKLADLLNENPAGILQFRDELTGLLAGWERSGREEDRAFYLEAWNGNGFKTVDRIGRGTIHVKNLCISLFGGIQPTKLLGYLKAATELENDGFVQRLQVAVYPDRPHWEYIDEYPDKQARDTVFRLIQQIADSDFSTIAYEADEFNRYSYTRFNSEAQKIFKQWMIEWETKVLPNESGLLLEHFTKYRSLVPSLALIFHVVNCVGATYPANPGQKYLVSAEAIKMAIEWCIYLQSHARRIYGLLDTQQVEAAKSLLSHLKAGHLKDGFKAGDVQRKGWANLSRIENVDAALDELVVHKWLIEVQPSLVSAKGGRPEAPHYRINPKIIPKA